MDLRAIPQVDVIGLKGQGEGGIKEDFRVFNKISVKQPPWLMANNHEAVTLACNYTYDKTPTEFRASLQKGTNSALEVCFVYVNGTHNPLLSTTEDFRGCLVDFDNKTVNFQLSNMSVKQTDIYFCKIEFMYPPPYLSNEKSNGTIIYVKEKEVCPTPKASESSKLFWVVAGALACFALYSVAGTVCYCCCWLKNKKNRILHSDYMNMTPRRPGPTKKHYQPYAPTRDYAAYRS
ncbi:T-cell-specific surface glycoprotein CD28 [Dromiciops gliroides]|uniref:T-cell-specific surface glycoprotein CD28 n=1 Tax=Dromiciops gliroides TaxID=33562 RepID=UPI001CC641E1|nr:T-cell-specific surface glycoprotein CD28 [Dromiciops gliroides]